MCPYFNGASGQRVASQERIEEWELIKELADVLKPLEAAMRLVSSQIYMTASLVLAVSDCLASAYENILANKLKGSLVTNVLNGIVRDLSYRLGHKKK